MIQQIFKFNKNIHNIASNVQFLNQLNNIQSKQIVTKELPINQLYKISVNYLNQKIQRQMLPKVHDIMNSNYYNQGCGCSSNFLKRLQQNMEDISDQLQKSDSKNAQLTKLIKILTDERNYYQEQLQKVQTQKRTIEEQLIKMKSDYDSKNLLINQLKKANRHLNEQVETLNENLQESKFLFEAQEQQIERIKKQKQLIQSEWNKVIKQVNIKMSRIQRQQQEEYKQNLQITSNLPLKDKVKKALRKIDKQIQESQGSNFKNKKINHTIKSLKPSFSTSSNQFFDQESI